METAHSTSLYSLGKGILKFDRFDADGLPTGMRDLGNAPVFNLTIEVETLEHYSSREGAKTLDKEVTMIKRLKGNFTLDEYDKENLKMFLLGQVDGYYVRPLTVSEVRGELYFKGTNEVGPKWSVNIWDAKIKPTGNLSFIAEDDWGKMEFEFTAQSDEENHPAEPYARIGVLGDS